VEVIAVSRRVQTLLFTDIVGSTDRLRDLGDAAWATLLVRHHDVLRDALAAHGGREVDTEVLLRRASGDDRTRAMQLLDQVRQGAAAIQAPNLVVQADALAARIQSGPPHL
jgi:class 3 adenylate cyclase